MFHGVCAVGCTIWCCEVYVKWLNNTHVAVASCKCNETDGGRSNISNSLGCGVGCSSFLICVSVCTRGCLPLNVLLPWEQLVTVLTREPRDWAVDGFGAEYYVRAKGSTCRVLCNMVAGGHAVLEKHPELEKLLTNFARPLLTRADSRGWARASSDRRPPPTSALAQEAQRTAVELLQMLRQRKDAAHALPPATPPTVHPGTVIVLALDESAEGTQVRMLQRVTKALENAG